LNRDRVLEIEFRRAMGAGFSKTLYLLFEACGRNANLMLLDEERKVIEAAKHIYPETNRYRSVIPGRPYVPPPPFAGIPLEDFLGSADELDDVAGIGKPLINALKKNFTGHGGLENVLKFFRDSVANQSCAPVGNVYQKLGEYVTLCPVHLDGAEEIGAKTALDAARKCVIQPLLDRFAERVRKKITARLDQLIRSNAKKIADAEALLGDESAAERLLLYGRLILANSWNIPRRAAEAELAEWTEDGERVHKVLLDPEKDAPQNAERYFTRYKKKQAAAERAKKTLPRLYLERDELRDQSTLLVFCNDAVVMSAIMEELSPARAVRTGRKSKPRALPPHRRYEIDAVNAAIFVGLSARGNHYVTFRLAVGDDIWMHAQNIPGAHVILRFKAKPDDESLNQAIEIAASAAACHSKTQGEGRVRVDYTERKHVRAITGGGLAQVTYKDFSTINADPALWLGLREASGENLSGPRAGEP
jgi:predicted ribosome quality control (RQC) complex YloA/Tae2 family protein